MLYAVATSCARNITGSEYKPPVCGIAMFIVDALIAISVSVSGILVIARPEKKDQTGPDKK